METKRRPPLLTYICEPCVVGSLERCGASNDPARGSVEAVNITPPLHIITQPPSSPKPHVVTAPNPSPTLISGAL